ncbi:MAG: hypothetical protein ABEJ61_10930 [Haloferacaceae archaeon]
MDDAVRAREATREALADIEPPDLRSTLDGHVTDASMTPAALTVVCARALDAGSEGPGLHERAAGVQLIYEGLRLTRRLVHDEPWASGDGSPPSADVPADLEILAADVLVSRGFYLLARTEAAGRAVEVVRAFGRDQTGRADAPDPDARDRELEADVLALAVAAGATAAGEEPRQSLVAYASALGRRLGDGFPPAATALDAEERDRLTAVATGEREFDAGSDGDAVPGRTATRES